MKVYSRTQFVRGVIAAILASCIGFTAFLFFSGTLGTPASARLALKESPSAYRQEKTETTSIPSYTQQTTALGIEVQQQKEDYSVDEKENISIYEKYNEAVVNITTELLFYNWFSEAIPQEGTSGSGTIIDSQGFVLTNKHVVRNAYKVYIGLADGSRYEAKVVGIDSENDLAVIKFSPPPSLKLKAISFGDSTNLKVGQKVLAIGNPFGLERTLTRGIVSGIGRPVAQSERGGGSTTTYVIQNMIQTDASINPGNSGGPLINARGELVGVNTMIYSPSGGSIGIGFAVPIATAKRVVPELIKNGSVQRGWIEFNPVPLFPDLVEYLRQNNYAIPIDAGLLISQTTRGGNADKAGLKGGNSLVRTRMSTFYVGGDVIVSINGVKTDSLAQLYVALETTRPGEIVEIVYYRNNKKLTTQVKLTARARSESAEL